MSEKEMKPFAIFLRWQKQNYTGKSTEIRHFGKRGRKLGQVVNSKDFGTVTKEKDKNWPIAGRRVSEIIVGRISAPNPVLFLKRRARKLSFNSYEDGDA